MELAGDTEKSKGDTFIMAILVAGGAGYIGSHTVAELLSKGEKVVVLDNFSKGHRAAVPKGCPVYAADLHDKAAVLKILKENDIQAVIHFAAFSLVGESVTEPLKYYDNNVYATKVLLECMKEADVDKIVFSSTAATYGEPESIPILETDRTLPTNPYGETKLAMERMFHWCDHAYGIRYTALRYFNAAGAHESGDIGEDHDPETHLIPLILKVAYRGEGTLKIFGGDYPTKDGTCIRDYIHVTDLANAHIAALDYLRAGGKSDVFNLGNGNGFSVKEVIETARKVTGKPIPAEVAPRRAGDPAVLVASSKKAQEVLRWKSEKDDLSTIIQTAWNFVQKHPSGYED